LADKIRAFLFIEGTTGKEDAVMKQVHKIPEVRETHLLTGKHDIMAVVESEETPIEPREKLVHIVVRKIGKLKNVKNTNTIIPAITESKSSIVERPERLARAFVFVQTNPGKELKVLKECMGIAEVTRAHLIPGKVDVLCELEVERGVAPPVFEKIALIVTERIARLEDVRDTETYTPVESKFKAR
jgi:DNA-binding Lrp family transcriptional regulator